LAELAAESWSDLAAVLFEYLTLGVGPHPSPSPLPPRPPCVPFTYREKACILRYDVAMALLPEFRRNRIKIN